MKKLIITSVICFVANMAAANQFTTTVNTLSVAPRYSTVVTPIKECHTKYVEETVPNTASAILGGIAGGVIGNNINGRQSKNRTEYAVGGAILGTIIGSQVPSGNSVLRETMTCDTRYVEETVIKDYTISYEYLGIIYTTVMQRSPGQTVKLRITVQPIE